jgi:hypothetical protein
MSAGKSIMRFECQFKHRDTGECKLIPVTLSANQVKSVEAIRAAGDAGLLAEAMALNRAYREVPKGFLHTEPPRAVVAS